MEVCNPVSEKIDYCRGCRGRNRMVVGFTTTYVKAVHITTNIVSSNPAQARCTRSQPYVIKFVSDLLWFSLRTPVSFTNKTDHRDMDKILLRKSR